MLDADGDINVTVLAKKIEDELNLRNNADYRVNPENRAKLETILNYLTNEAKRQGGRLKPVHLVPKEKHGYIEATFDVFDVYGESLTAFKEALALVDVFAVEPLIDGRIGIGININNVYERIPN